MPMAAKSNASAAKLREDNDGKAIGYQRFAHDLVHRSHACHRVIGIHRLNRGHNTRGHGGWVSIGPHANRRIGPGALVKRHIHLSRAGRRVALILHVVKNANNLPFHRGAERRSVIREQFHDFDALRQGVEPGQVFSGKALADHRDPRRACEIPPV